MSTLPSARPDKQPPAPIESPVPSPAPAPLSRADIAKLFEELDEKSRKVEAEAARLQARRRGLFGFTTSV